jgi:hypothetical protein
VILVHWTGWTDYHLSGDEAVALFIERMGLAFAVEIDASKNRLSASENGRTQKHLQEQAFGSFSATATRRRSR